MKTLLIPLALTLTACNSGHLTRANAKLQLEQHMRQVQDENRGQHYLLVRIGTVANCEAMFESYDFDPVRSNAATAVLSATGYLTVRPIKKHVWDVDLTERGRQSIAGEKYGHQQKGDCDEWQVSIPLAKYDHLDVTGIVEDGVHARVDVSLTFVITPVGMAVRKVASTQVFEVNKTMFGEELAKDFLDRELKDLLGDNLFYTPQNSDRYVKQIGTTFEKYDDGWKVSKEK